VNMNPLKVEAREIVVYTDNTFGFEFIRQDFSDGTSVFMPMYQYNAITLAAAKNPDLTKRAQGEL
jgi:hypothetical protein